MPDLSVSVHGHDIVVAQPNSGLSVTYRKLGYSPMLMALDSMRGDLEPEKLDSLCKPGRPRLRKPSHSDGLTADGLSNGWERALRCSRLRRVMPAHSPSFSGEP